MRKVSGVVKKWGGLSKNVGSVVLYLLCISWLHSSTVLAPPPKVSSLLGLSPNAHAHLINHVVEVELADLARKQEASNKMGGINSPRPSLEGNPVPHDRFTSSSERTPNTRTSHPTSDQQSLSTPVGSSASSASSADFMTPVKPMITMPKWSPMNDFSPSFLSSSAVPQSPKGSAQSSMQGAPTTTTTTDPFPTPTWMATTQQTSDFSPSSFLISSSPSTSHPTPAVQQSPKGSAQSSMQAASGATTSTTTTTTTTTKRIGSNQDPMTDLSSSLSSSSAAVAARKPDNANPSSSSPHRYKTRSRGNSLASSSSSSLSASSFSPSFDAEGQEEQDILAVYRDQARGKIKSSKFYDSTAFSDKELDDYLAAEGDDIVHGFALRGVSEQILTYITESILLGRENLFTPSAAIKQTMRDKQMGKNMGPTDRKRGSDGDFIPGSVARDINDREVKETLRGVKYDPARNQFVYKSEWNKDGAVSIPYVVKKDNKVYILVQTHVDRDKLVKFDGGLDKPHDSPDGYYNYVEAGDLKFHSLYSRNAETLLKFANSDIPSISAEDIAQILILHPTYHYGHIQAANHINNYGFKDPALNIFPRKTLGSNQPSMNSPPPKSNVGYPGYTPQDPETLGSLDNNKRGKLKDYNDQGAPPIYTLDKPDTTHPSETAVVINHYANNLAWQFGRLNVARGEIDRNHPRGVHLYKGPGDPPAYQPTDPEYAVTKAEYIEMLSTPSRLIDKSLFSIFRSVPPDHELKEVVPQNIDILQGWVDPESSSTSSSSASRSPAATSKPGSTSVSMAHSSSPSPPLQPFKTDHYHQEPTFSVDDMTNQVIEAFQKWAKSPVTKDPKTPEQYQKNLLQRVGQNLGKVEPSVIKNAVQKKLQKKLGVVEDEQEEAEDS